MNDIFLVVENNTVVNLIVWSGEAYSPGHSTTMIPSHLHPGVGIGWQLIDGVWTEPTYLETVDESSPDL